MIWRAHRYVARICVFVCFAIIAVQTATAQRRFVLREKPYIANRLPLIPSRESAPPASTTKHCVWRVMNVPGPFYLVGTIHTLRTNDYPLAEIYGKTLRDSKRLVFEYNPKEDAFYAKKFRAAGQYPPGQDIRSNVRRETLDLLLRNLAAFHLSFDEIKQYKPWALAYRLWSIRGYAAAARVQSVDGYLAYHAQRLGKEVAGLETVDEHVAFWANTLQLDGERLLVETLVRGNRLNDRFDETRVAWKKGDLGALSATNAGLRDVDLSTSQRLLDRRNAKWLARIESEMKTGKPTAIVAGTAHFVGPNSVVDLLRKRGYKIEQL